MEDLDLSYIRYLLLLLRSNSYCIPQRIRLQQWRDWDPLCLRPHRMYHRRNLVLHMVPCLRSTSLPAPRHFRRPGDLSPPRPHGRVGCPTRHVSLRMDGACFGSLACANTRHRLVLCVLFCCWIRHLPTPPVELPRIRGEPVCGQRRTAKLVCGGRGAFWAATIFELGGGEGLYLAWRVEHSAGGRILVFVHVWGQVEEEEQVYCSCVDGWTSSRRFLSNKKKNIQL